MHHIEARPPPRPMIGFTLIELMIVLVIVGILAAIAIPTYYHYLAKAQFAEAMSLASGVKTAVADAHQGRDSLVGLNNGTGSVPAATDISGTYVSRVEVNNGVITSHFSDDSALAGKVAILEPEIAGGSLEWRCRTDVSAARSPAPCDSVAVIVPKEP